MLDVQKKDGLAERRRRVGLTIYALARRAGVRWLTLRDLESGKRRPQKRTLDKIERALQAVERDSG
jgi:predicted transcriptional regulator